MGHDFVKQYSFNTDLATLLQSGRIYALVTRGAGGHFPQWKFAKKVNKFWHQHQLAGGWVGKVHAPEVGKVENWRQPRQPMPLGESYTWEWGRAMTRCFLIAL